MTSQASHEGYKGIFISFEGGEGVGKSTQLKLLSKFLVQKAIPHCLTREPGGTPGAEILRDLILSETAPQWDHLTEALLIHAARREHLQRIIFPALSQGKWVLCDRFLDSSFVYQGAYPDVGTDVISQLSMIIMGDFHPDLTFFLDLDAAEGLDRKFITPLERNRFEIKGHDYHQKIRESFRARAAITPARNVVIPADLAIETIAEKIRYEVTKRFLEA